MVLASFWRWLRSPAAQAENAKEDQVRRFIFKHSKSQVLEVVGHGNTAMVYKLTTPTDVTLALKCIKKTPHQQEYIQREREIGLELHHPFITSLRLAFQSPTHFYLGFDYYTGGELFHRLEREGTFSLERTRLYAAEIVLALTYLHDNAIVYRDLKPENLLLDAQGHLRLGDFGLSVNNVRGTPLREFVGTAEYLAPEVINRQSYGIAIDYWALGILVYEMLVGMSPFYDANSSRMYRRIVSEPLQGLEELPDCAQSFLQALLCKSPDKRLGASAVSRSNLFQHPFFATLDWEQVKMKKYPPEYVPRGLKARKKNLRAIPLQEFVKQQTRDAQSPGKQVAVPEFTYLDAALIEKDPVSDLL